MDLLMTGIDCYKQKRAGSIKSAAGPVFAQTGFYSMAVSGWKTFTSLSSSPKYSLSLGPRMPKERQIRVHR
ncbi:MAG: hypothetical protein QG618_2261 [Thermodesulfobacteriota bacterium]|nr:hypothetical protein [Thermodesulfobacteriota bacterium]